MTRTRSQYQSAEDRWPINTESTVDIVAPHYIDVPHYGPDLPEDPLVALGFGLRVQRRPVADERWAGPLRRFARAFVWLLPAAALCLVLTTLGGWPTPTRPPTGESPGTWLLVTVLGLLLALMGLIALCALLATTPGRRWAAAALPAALAGTSMVLPMLGVFGLARPAVSRSAADLGAGVARSLDDQFARGAVGRWLAVSGLLLLALGWICLACAILACDVLNRFDGWLVLAGVLVAGVGAYLSWRFLLPVAGLMLLAAALGVARSATRLAAEEP